MNAGTTKAQSFVSRTPLAILAGFLIRLRLALGTTLTALRKGLAGVRDTRETTNFNYALEPLNLTHLAHWASQVSGAPVSEILRYFDEIRADECLWRAVAEATAHSPFRYISDSRPEIGRRIAWYALVRAIRPLTIVETGIDKGLGTCVLAAGIRRNGSGHVWGVDIAPKAGWLVARTHPGEVTLAIGDAVTSLADLPVSVDLYIHDVHASEEQEREELEALLPRLHPGSVIINDNAHAYPLLPDLAARSGWAYHHFTEDPRRHWYPGAGMGGVRLQ